MTKDRQKAASKLDGLRALGRPGISRQLDTSAVAQSQPRLPHQSVANPLQGPTKPKRGRPRLEDRASTLAATKPWDKLEMSERTWYRRQREIKERQE